MSNEYLFSCTEDPTEIGALYRALQSIDCEVKMANTEIKQGEMGFEEILIVLISSAVLPAVLHVIETWLQNRKTELTITDKKTGKSLTFKSENGKIPKNLKTFLK